MAPATGGFGGEADATSGLSIFPQVTSGVPLRCLGKLSPARNRPDALSRELTFHVFCRCTGAPLVSDLSQSSQIGSVR